MKMKKFRVRCSTITKYVGMLLESVNDVKIRLLFIIFTDLRLAKEQT